jgi:hypothetical protein
MITENIKVSGQVGVELYSSSGELLHSAGFTNLVTTDGKEFLTRKLVDDPEKIEKIGIGSGTSAATLADTALEASLSERDIRFQSTENNIASFISTFEEDEPAVPVTVSEVGLLSDADLLICRAVLDTPFTKETTDYLVINWKLQIG